MPASTLTDNLIDLTSDAHQHTKRVPSGSNGSHTPVGKSGQPGDGEPAEQRARGAEHNATRVIAPTDTASLLALLDNGLKTGPAARVQPLGFEPLDRVLGGGLRTHDL